MRIHFDYELTGKYDLSQLDKPTTKMIEELREFIKMRLSVLKEEMDQEPDGYIVIKFMTGDGMLSFYSESLSKKIFTCVTAEDLEFFSKKFLGLPPMGTGELPNP